MHRFALVVCVFLSACAQRGILDISISTTRPVPTEVSAIEVVDQEAMITLSRAMLNGTEVQPYVLRLVNPGGVGHPMTLNINGLGGGAALVVHRQVRVVVPSSGIDEIQVVLDCEPECPAGRSCVAGACVGGADSSVALDGSAMVLPDAGPRPTDAFSPRVDAPMMSVDASVTDAFAQPDAFASVDAFSPPTDAFCAGMMCVSGCIDTTRDVSNCGGCGRGCGRLGASATTCENSICTFSFVGAVCRSNHGNCFIAGLLQWGIDCAAGFRDADDNRANGCEAQI